MPEIVLTEEQTRALVGPPIRVVIKDPSGQGFSAMVWELDQNSSLGLCTFFRQQNAYCDVMTPESFASIATLAAQSEKALPVPQGADSAPRSKKRQRR